MVSLRLIVPLGCLIATSLALPRISASSEAEAIRCLDWTGEETSFADGISETCICRVAETFGGNFAYEFYRRLVSNEVLGDIDLCRPMETRSSTLYVTDNGGNADLEDAEVQSTQDPSKISSCGYDTTGSPHLSPTRVDATPTGLSGSCGGLNGRGLSDHLNPTFPDEDEGEE